MQNPLLIPSLALALLAAGSQATAAERSVTTSKTWLSGATTIFARMTVTGLTTAQIAEQGLCYSTSGTPTIDSLTTKAYISNNGNIYKISDLQPSTVYYIRAYAKPRNGEVVYGEVRKAITKPGGSISYGVFGFSGDADTRVQAAAKEGVGLWNEYTCIKGLYFNINYGSGTPTADCSYGGYMRVGPNSAYQATGTILHEGLHAVGVGTLGLWNGNSWMRGGSNSGAWRGVRVNRVIKFWENDETATLKGDGTHMWPYGVNGAHEDNKTQALYVGNSMLCEALGEDGLSPTSSQFATPTYAFEQDDSTKYYIKNEKYGLGTSYLTEGKLNRLRLLTLTEEEAAKNDSAAWYVTFDPATCYYMLRNVATGNYMTYNTSGNNGIKTKNTDTPTAKEKFHFIPSCVDAVSSNGYSLQGFWIAYVTNNTPSALALSSSKTPQSTSWSFTEAASQQRWVLLSRSELTTMNGEMLAAAKAKLDEVLAHIAALQAVSHEETTAGADAALAATVASIKEKADATTSPDDIDELTDEAEAAIKTFLAGVRATDDDNPFDLTFMLQNADLAAATGWSESPTISYGVGEFYEKTFDMNQTLTKMPAGAYELKAQGFQRPGTSANVYTAWNNGTDNVTTTLYMRSVSTKLCNIMADAQSKKLGGAESTVATNVYIPNNMQAASIYFGKGLYENAVSDTLKRQASLKIGLKCTSSSSSYWTIFDNFRLYYHGVPGDASGIRSLNAATATQQGRQGIYTLSGTLVGRDASKLATLPKGLYVVDGKKVIVK